MTDDFRFGDPRARDDMGGCCGKPVGCQNESQGCVRKKDKRDWQEKAAVEVAEEVDPDAFGAAGYLLRPPTETDASLRLAAWEAEHDGWLGGIVLDAAIWDDDHTSVTAMDINILRGHILTMLTRVLSSAPTREADA